MILLRTNPKLSTECLQCTNTNQGTGKFLGSSCLNCVRLTERLHVVADYMQCYIWTFQLCTYSLVEMSVLAFAPVSAHCSERQDCFVCEFVPLGEIKVVSDKA